MRSLYFLLVASASVAACRTGVDIPDSYCDSQDMATKPSPDMTTPQAKCAAAEGLKGDSLLCVDFKDVQTLSSLTGWDFSLCIAGWTVAGGKLQVTNFSTFADTCTFKVPALSAADYQKYSRFTLSVVHKLDVNDLQQKAQIMLGADDQSNRLLDWMTGKQPRKQWTQTVAKADLPLMAQGSFQPLFKLSSLVSPGGGYSGWQIESIAIQGIP